MRDDYLAHHGILGQKWGVRRYQNTDGSLTSAGKARYQSQDGRLTEEGKALASKVAEGGHFIRGVVSDEEAKKIGLEKGDKYDILKKGSELTRLAGEGDQIDEKRKYVSLTPYDNNAYEADAEFLPMNGVPYKFKYETLKDLKIARADDVVNTMIDRYGDTKVSDLEKNTFSKYAEYNLDDCLAKYGSLTMRELRDSAKVNEKIASNWDARTSENKWLYDRAEFLTSAYRTFVHQKLIGYDTEASKEIQKEYKDKGYDAIVDYEDWSGGFQYPLILLNPKGSIKQKSKEKLYG